jgi:hypothetical protein
MESIRSIGYTLESAIADLIDNSITAGASIVNIRFSPYGQPYLAILDNGSGMSPEELTRAMRHGSKNPWDPRTESDLGRFGLGLKTASLSQCRRLTVVSLKDGILSARCWDLDIIIDEEEWVLLDLEYEEIIDLPLVSELELQESGTLVLWQYLDRISNGETSIEKALGDKMEQASEHLALVFHRYLSGEQGLTRLKLIINGHSLEAADPFLLSNRATEPLHEENVQIEGHSIKIKPFILPHISKLSPEELNSVGGEEGFRRNQGFYVYRNKRLIIWGTWFRLIKQEELTKLARVRVDIPNTLDHLWTIDVKKSTAHPPEVVRNNLRRIVARIADGSRRVYTFRGRKINSDKFIHLWERMQGRKGISYQINRNHPLVKIIFSKINDEEKNILKLLLSSLEANFPADALYADMASDHKIKTIDEEVEEDLRFLAEYLFGAASSIEGGREKMLEGLHLLEPFCQYPDFTKKIVREYSNVE